MIERIYKLTDADGYTRRGLAGETKWTPGKWVRVKWGGDMCRAGCLHAYAHPLLAEMFDYQHTNVGATGILWASEGTVKARAHDKLGCSRMRVLRRRKRVIPTTTQRVAFGILCALEVYHSKEWRDWAERWLSGEDRSRAAYAAYANASAVYAAAAVVYAANAANAAAAAYANASAANAANAANAAANAKPLDLIALAKRAMKVKP